MPPCHPPVRDLRQRSPFARLSRHELRRLGQLCTTISFAPGKVLARQGHLGREFVIVVEGTAREIGDGHERGVLEPGQHFGELAIVCGIRNPLTIVARTPVTLDVMSTREFLSAYRTMPLVRKHIDTHINQQIASWPDPTPSRRDHDGPHLGPTDEDPYTLAS